MAEKYFDGSKANSEAKSIAFPRKEDALLLRMSVMKDITWKWVYSFVALVALLGWGIFNLVLMVKEIDRPSTVTAVGLAGTSTITGFLISLNTDIKQFWFRKKPPDQPSSSEPPAQQPPDEVKQ
jgi:hypothetical protein